VRDGRVLGRRKRSTRAADEVSLIRGWVTNEDRNASADEVLRKESDRELFFLRLCRLFLFRVVALQSAFGREVVGIVDNLIGSVSVDNKPQ
jgi:hypothetical protein